MQKIEEDADYDAVDGITESIAKLWINNAEEFMNEAKKYPGQEKAVFDFYLKNKNAVESLKAPVFEEKIVDFVLAKAQLKEKIVSVQELYSFEEKKGSKK